MATTREPRDSFTIKRMKRYSVVKQSELQGVQYVEVLRDTRYYLAVLLGLVEEKCTLPFMNFLLGVLIGVMFLVKSYAYKGTLSWYGLWLRIVYFCSMLYDIWVLNPNLGVDGWTRFLYGVPHISGIILAASQIGMSWSEYECTSWQSCL